CSDAILVDPLPAGSSFVSGSSTLGSLTNNGGIISSSLGTITNGTRGTVTIVVSGALAGSFTNTITLSARTPDPNANNSSASSVVTILGPPNLALGPPAINFGPVVIVRTNTALFQLTNTGSLTLTGAVSTATPFSVSPTSFTINGGQVSSVAVSFVPCSLGN